MEKQLGRKAGTKNKTWCGIPISLYRRKKSELSKEEFKQWWIKKTGRPVDIRYPAKGDAAVENLKKQLDAYKSSVDILDRLLREKAEYINKLESRSWIQRLFNSKP